MVYLIDMPISYSIVCEDVAHYHFTKCVLNTFEEGNLFLFNEACYRQYKLRTRKEVLNQYVNISNQAFRTYPIDLLIVMFDYDDEPLNNYLTKHTSLAEAVYRDIKDKVLITIPIQAIEHWLRYLQWKAENPDSTRNISIEAEDRSTSKQVIYGTKKPSKEKTEAAINELFDESNMEWLSSRSTSFNHFYSQVKRLPHS